MRCLFHISVAKQREPTSGTRVNKFFSPESTINEFTFRSETCLLTDPVIFFACLPDKPSLRKPSNKASKSLVSLAAPLTCRLLAICYYRNFLSNIGHNIPVMCFEQTVGIWSALRPNT